MKMVEVTRDGFLAVICGLKLDVHPRIVGAHSQERGYTQEWKFRNNRSMMGRTVERGPRQYFLTREYAAKIHPPAN